MSTLYLRNLLDSTNLTIPPNFTKIRYPLTVTDLINRIVQVLKEDLYWVKISTQKAELMEPVKP